MDFGILCMFFFNFSTSISLKFKLDITLLNTLSLVIIAPYVDTKFEFNVTSEAVIELLVLLLPDTNTSVVDD